MLTCGVVAIALLVTLAGCYNEYTIVYPTLATLNGYRAGQVRKLVDASGQAFNFDRDTQLVVQGIQNEVLLEERFVVLDVDGPIVKGETSRGRKVSVDLRYASGVVAKNYSEGQTAGLIVGCVLGTLAMAGVVAFGALIGGAH